MVLLGKLDAHNLYFILLEYLFLILLSGYAIHRFNPYSTNKITSEDRTIGFVIGVFVIWLLDYKALYDILKEKFGSMYWFSILDIFLTTIHPIFKFTEKAYDLATETVGGQLGYTLKQSKEHGQQAVQELDNRYNVTRDLTDQNKLYNVAFSAAVF